jgi:translation elongation factor EF-4
MDTLPLSARCPRIARTRCRASLRGLQPRKEIASCCGGDISRKRKLLEQQKKGKQRVKQVGRIEGSTG